MKKTLAAVAVLGAFASSAFAANVTLYGSVSTGLVYTHTKAGINEGSYDADKKAAVYNKDAASNKFEMQSAWAGDSVFGLTGEEELGNGWKVGFALENEFASDTGALNDSDKIFDSMAYLWVGNDTVKLAAGNLGGSLASASGDFDLVGGFDPLEAAYGNGGMGLFATRDMAFDNAIDIELTPIDGLKFSFQMSLEDGNDQKLTGWGQQDHYYGLGASYENGPLAVSVVAERFKYANDADEKSGSAYTFGASWDFEVVKPTFMYQHTEHMSLGSFCDGLFEDLIVTHEAEGDEDDFDNEFSIKTDSFLLGATAPLGNGTLGASVQYTKIKPIDIEEGENGKAWVFGVAYNYELSKRTSLYAAGVYSKGQKSLSDVGAVNNYQLGIGLNHTF